MNVKHKIEGANITVIETENKETNIMRKTIIQNIPSN